ncbi:hypothetical protein [Polaribacter cellanae]|uniref:Lipoprotein n=1 Tax=Polaribacter cellanae TaxID=2818493 RepID=A0A975CMQ8_9FLAO|nr:hypothetical protein [Polaribacter cellanae]QTE21380.1 hypothetical protein J3359_11135 [Polaribacter cellanae]
MKKTILTILILTAFAISCKRKSEESKNNTKSFKVEQQKEVTSQIHQNIITKNKGKYASEINFFDKNNISLRLKKLTGVLYKEMVKNFNVQTPIVSENSIYKLTGCLKHNCPAYMVTILYDSKGDNLNVLIDENGKLAKFAEKDKIKLTKSLKIK